MIDREQLSLRQAVAWLGDPITVAARPVCLRSHTPTTQLRTPTTQLVRSDETGAARVSAQRVDQTGVAAPVRCRSGRARSIRSMIVPPRCIAQLHTVRVR